MLHAFHDKRRHTGEISLPHRRKQRTAVFAAFTLPYPYHIAAAVNIIDAQGNHFRDSQATRIRSYKDSTIFNVSYHTEEARQFFHTENLRKALLSWWKGKVSNNPVLFKSDTV